MKNKNKIMLITLGCVGFLIGVLIFTFYINFYDNEVMSDTKEHKSTSNKMMSLMLETKYKSGVYEVSKDSKWPGDGYTFNSELSSCENGGTLTWNEDKRTVALKTRLSDKCYVYFDVEPHDLNVVTTNLSATYGKIGNINCVNSSATYNQRYNRIEVSSVDGKWGDCELNYTESTSKINFADYIISLAGTTQGMGQVVNENGYRYEGKNPNNYVWFNNEYWRIIGVFNESSHGQSGKNMVKIIRDEVLDNLAWQKYKENDWTKASLNLLLNGTYYNAIDGINSGYCYKFSNIITGNCNYTKKGIQDEYRSMIANVTWYLGGYSSTSATAETLYEYERWSTVYSERPTTTKGYIGLMYPSDYGYSVLASSCARTINLDSYNVDACAGASWLYGKGFEWTVSPFSSSSDSVFFVGNQGNFSGKNGAESTYGVRPVLYLDSSVYKIDGSGTLSSPIIVGM